MTLEWDYKHISATESRIHDPQSGIKGAQKVIITTVKKEGKRKKKILCGEGEGVGRVIKMRNEGGSGSKSKGKSWRGVEELWIIAYWLKSGRVVFYKIKPVAS